MSDLLNCLRCGSTPQKIPRFNMGYCGDGVKCKCGLETPKHLTDERAINWWNTRTQSQWIEQELTPAIKKCFKSLIGCDGVLMVAVDDYNELVKVLNKKAGE